MRFKAGVLGVVVIIMALVGTLMGSWIMSMDVEEVQVTRYSALADIVGEFDSEQTPTFTDYNPSTNYTGYYTEDSIIDSTKYFDGVDYTASNPNNYRLNLMPENRTTGTVTITDAEDTGRIPHFYVWWQETGAGYQTTPGLTSMSFEDLVQAKGWAQNSITLVCPEPDYTVLDGRGIVTFCSSRDLGALRSDSVLMKQPGMTGTLSFVETSGGSVVVTATYNASDVMTPILAARYDGGTHAVILYADREMTEVVSSGSSTDTFLILSGKFYQSADLDYTLATIPPATYMDPSAGVVMS